MAKVCYLGLGANLNDPAQQLRCALQALDATPGIRLDAWSSFYRSRPVGPQDQPDYVNAVARIETGLPALALLDALQAIENNQGRVRLRRWGERTLDLDLLLYGDEVIQNERLTVPHIEMTRRLFVVQPLAEIAPQLRLTDGKSALEWQQQLADQDDLVILETPSAECLMLRSCE